MFIQQHNGVWVGENPTDVLVVRKPDGTHTYQSPTGNVQVTVKATQIVDVKVLGQSVRQAEFEDPKRDFHVVRASSAGIQHA